MYLLKARERLQDVEREEAREQRRHELGIEELYIVQGAIYTEGMPEDGPKGAKMKCKYIGSFRVYPPDGLSGRALQSAVGGFVSETIRNINPKRVRETLSVTMNINRHGVKIFKSKKLFMAYPLRRVLNCQMFPNPPLFGMLCKNVDEDKNRHYCHVFHLSSAEEASELNQLLSHAFKVAYAHKNVLNSLERKGGGSPASAVKSSKPKKKTKSSPAPQQTSRSPPLPSYDSLPVTPVPNAPSYESLITNTDPVLPSYESLATTSFPVIASAAGGGATPLSDRRSGSISGAHVTVEGLEEEVRRLQHKVNDTETQLNALSPEDDAVFELTLELSSYEDQLQVKQQQLQTLLEMALGDHPVPHYSAGGGAVGVDMVDGDQFLEDAEWYQAGLPREVVMGILTQEPQGSFIVRDSASNPGCLALSVKNSDGQILHFLIIRDEKGYYMQDSTKHHPSLTSLILYHASTVDHIPCRLSLGATNLLSDSREVAPSTGNYSDDSDMDDEEMLHHLAQMNMLKP